MSPFPIGTRVTFADEPNATTVGTVVTPTVDELAYAKTYLDPVGPEHGDLLIEWDEGIWDRAWYRPVDLQVCLPVTTEVETP